MMPTGVYQNDISMFYDPIFDFFSNEILLPSSGGQPKALAITYNICGLYNLTGQQFQKTSPIPGTVILIISL